MYVYFGDEGIFWKYIFASKAMMVLVVVVVGGHCGRTGEYLGSLLCLRNRLCEFVCVCEPRKCKNA